MMTLLWIFGALFAALAVFVVAFYSWLWFTGQDEPGVRFEWDLYDVGAAIAVACLAVVVFGSFGAGYLAGWYFTSG